MIKTKVLNVLKEKSLEISKGGFNKGSIKLLFLAEDNTGLSGTGVFYDVSSGFHIKMMVVLLT